MNQIKELLDAVYIINEGIYDNDPESSIPVIIETDGYINANVKWLHNRLWTSEEDERLQDEEGEYIENYEQCLRRKMRELVQEFNKLKI